MYPQAGIRFAPGVPTYTYLTNQNNGWSIVPFDESDEDSYCGQHGAPARVSTMVYDQFENPFIEPGISVDFEIHEQSIPVKALDADTVFTGTVEGTITSGLDSNQVTAETSEQGNITLELKSTLGPNAVNVRSNLMPLDESDTDTIDDVDAYFENSADSEMTRFPQGDCCEWPIELKWGETSDKAVDPATLIANGGSVATIAEYHPLVNPEIGCTYEQGSDMVFMLQDVPLAGLYRIKLSASDECDYDLYYVETSIYKGIGVDSCPGVEMQEGYVEEYCSQANAGDSIWAYLEPSTTYWIIVEATLQSIDYYTCFVDVEVAYEWSEND
jgi:hypothetical protein